MPERIVGQVADLKELLILAMIGMAVGLGQLLASTESLTPRIIVGRCLSTAGIAMAAAAIMVWFPDMGFVAKCGVAAGLASLGTSGLEKIFQRIAGGS